MLDSFPVGRFGQIAFGCSSVAWLFLALFSDTERLTSISALILCAILAGTSSSKAIINSIDKYITRPGQTIAIITIFVIVATITTIYAAPTIHSKEFSESLLASWLANLAFFLTLGIIGVVASISKPEDLPFDARARIFFGGQRGPHIDHAIEHLKANIKHYSESATVEIRIHEHEPNTNLFFVAETFTSDVVCFVRDHETDYPIKVDYTDLSDPPPNRPPAKLVAVQDFPTGRRSITYPLSGEGTISAAYDIPMVNGKRGTVESTLHWWWTPSTERNTQTLIRFTKKFDLLLKNELSEDIQITLHDKYQSQKDNDEKKINTSKLMVGAGSTARLLSLQNIEPDLVLYDLRIEPAKKPN